VPVGKNRSLWPVQPGDYIDIKGVIRQIVLVWTTAPLASLTVSPPEYEGDVLILDAPMPYAVSATTEYKIIRSPRPIPGESSVKMPETVAVDLRMNFAFPGVVNLPAGSPPPPCPLGNPFAPR